MPLATWICRNRHAQIVLKIVVLKILEKYPRTYLSFTKTWTTSRFLKWQTFEALHYFVEHCRDFWQKVLDQHQSSIRFVLFKVKGNVYCCIHSGVSIMTLIKFSTLLFFSVFIGEYEYIFYSGQKLRRGKYFCSISINSLTFA